MVAGPHWASPGCSAGEAGEMGSLPPRHLEAAFPVLAAYRLIVSLLCLASLVKGRLC